MNLLPSLDKINSDMDNVIEELANSEEFEPTPLKTAEVKKTEFKRQLKEKLNVNQTQARIQETVQLILDKLSYVAGPEAAHKFEEELKNTNQNFQSYAQKVADGSLSPEQAQNNYQKILGFSDDSIIAIYQLGCDCFSKGDLESAEKIFELLVYLTPEVASHWISYGLCLENKHDLQGALVAFKIASDINPENIQGTICYIRCLNELGLLAETKTEMENLEKFISNKKELKNTWGKEIDSLKLSIK